MKTISVSVEDEIHRQARIKAAQMGTSMSAMLRDYLLKILEEGGDFPLQETEPQRRARKLDEVLERFKREGIGVDTSQILTREEIYNRNAAGRNAAR